MVILTEKEKNILDKIKPYTMTSFERCINAINLVKKINKNKIEGDIIECGIWKCGILVLMKLIDDNEGGERKIRGFDSFKYEISPVSIDEVKNILKDLNAENILLYEGYFQDSIPNVVNEIKKISILRLDASHYDATTFCLENFYDKVNKGGYIVIDDYGDYEPCKQAIEDFRSKNNITDQIFQTDYTEIWWEKTK